MSESKHIVCPACEAVNRLPAQRLNDQPNCGKCKSPLFTGEPQNLTDANFQRVIVNSDLPVVVDFWASWCGPCQMMAPIFSAVTKALEPRVRMAKVNTEEAQMLAAQYGIRSIPTLAIFKNGQEVARQAGVLQGPQLQAWIEQHI
ncbi:thioredoxin TrxC [Oceanospirillum sediminis]|uniref:Thioredoxin n=1 Tax=Oceanospirillum sediminis TaxID=2760088 RepID=A0A839IQG8_9GAMM|nr:thioredoxin TrxC [Oceanospirillum sediminis]MBB1486914.1 thioredoxin TrxC [Oceanospirillum sediminis]